MSDSEGKFTEGERARAKSWFARIKPKPKCALCLKEDWILGKNAYAPLGFDRAKTEFIASSIFPQFFLVCKNCGHSLVVNGLVAGVFKNEDDDDDDSDCIEV